MTVSAHREAAQWWVDELRAAVDQSPATPAAVDAVVRAQVPRVSPTLLAAAARLIGVRLSDRDSGGPGTWLVGRLITAEQQRVRAGQPSPSPGDLCVCGHSRNHHSGYGLGRCLAAGCDECQRLIPPP